MRKRFATCYPWIVGLAGFVLLGWRFVYAGPALSNLLSVPNLALLAMFAVLEVYRVPIHGNIAAGFSTVSVVVAVILGGELPALAMSLGGLAILVNGPKMLRPAVFNAGAYAISAAAGSIVASLAGYPVLRPTVAFRLAGPLIFVAVYALVTAVLVGIYSALTSRGGKPIDQLLSLGIHGLLVVISMSLGVSIALAYVNFGQISLYFMCVILAMLSYLLNLAARVSANREGLFALYQAASSINEALTPQEVFDRARSFTQGLLHEDFTWLALPTGDESGGLAVAYSWFGDGVDLERASAHVAAISAVSQDRGHEEQYVWMRGQGGTSSGYFGWVAVTGLHLGKQFVGEFGVASLSVPNDVTSDKLQLLAVLSSHLALAVDNALKFERATMLAHTDPLTGLYNYRQFQNLLREAIARAEKSESEVSVIYIDLDYFREINNTYGHQVGDEALKAIAKTIRASCRDRDLVCRPGGDEFTVILPGVSKDRARTVAARIKENLLAMKLDVGLPEPLSSAIGASVGVSTYPEDGSDVDTLVRKADADMYSSKNEGGRCASVGG